jgi:hypothetical protein
MPVTSRFEVGGFACWRQAQQLARAPSRNAGDGAGCDAGIGTGGSARRDAGPPNDRTRSTSTGPRCESSRSGHDLAIRLTPIPGAARSHEISERRGIHGDDHARNEHRRMRSAPEAAQYFGPPSQTHFCVILKLTQDVTPMRPRHVLHVSAAAIRGRIFSLSGRRPGPFASRKPAAPQGEVAPPSGTWRPARSTALALR